MNSKLELCIASASENWWHTDINDDAVFTWNKSYDTGDTRSLLIVASGFGRHSDVRFAGKISSDLAVSVIHHSTIGYLEEIGFDKSQVAHLPLSEFVSYESVLEGALRSGIQTANKEIYGLWKQSKLDFQSVCTVACVLVSNELATIANVGDCRVYHFRDGKLNQLSVDHTLIQKLLKKGESISPDDIEKFDSIVYQTLGSDEAVPHSSTLTLASGDQLVLCSPGLCKRLDDNKILEFLIGDEAPDITVKNLIEEAKGHRKEYSYSVIVAKV